MPAKSQRGFIPFIFLLLIALALPAGLLIMKRQADIRSQAAGRYESLGFPSKVGFDAASWRCRLGPNPNDEFITGGQLTFSLFYDRCKAQFFQDIDLWDKNNIRAVRLWPLLHQFVYNKETASYGN